MEMEPWVEAIWVKVVVWPDLWFSYKISKNDFEVIVGLLRFVSPMRYSSCLRSGFVWLAAKNCLFLFELVYSSLDTEKIFVKMKK